MTRVERTELGLKLLAAAIACFGVWKFFADRTEAARVAAAERSLAYVSRFADADVVAARGELMAFWREHSDFIESYRQSGEVSRAAYQRFVTLALAEEEDRWRVDSALFRTLVLYDEVAFCRASDACDAAILDAFFCKYVTRHANVYGPFYALLSQEVGTSDIDAALQDYAAACET